jgi:hypothetical protein
MVGILNRIFFAGNAGLQCLALLCNQTARHCDPLAQYRQEIMHDLTRIAKQTDQWVARLVDLAW